MHDDKRREQSYSPIMGGPNPIKSGNFVVPVEHFSNISFDKISQLDASTLDQKGA
jgi:hypothetical protein